MTHEEWQKIGNATTKHGDRYNVWLHSGEAVYNITTDDTPPRGAGGYPYLSSILNLKSATMTYEVK